MRCDNCGEAVSSNKNNPKDACVLCGMCIGELIGPEIQKEIDQQTLKDLNRLDTDKKV